MSEARPVPAPPTPGRSSLDDVIDVYKRDVDVTLLDEALKLTPDERVKRMVEAARFAEELRRAAERAR